MTSSVSIARCSVLAILINAACSLPASATTTIGANMVTYLSGQVGNRLGGGECSHMATEALRINGGEFYPGTLGTNNPVAGAYVWGTSVKVIKVTSGVWSDSNTSNACLPGDIIQYVNAVFTIKTTTGGTTTTTTINCPQHTSVVSAVTSGYPTNVYQQNFNNVRTVQSAAIDVKTLTSGSLYIYRAIALTNPTNTWKFAVVNNATTAQTFTVNVGTTVVLTQSVTAANTAGSYVVIDVSSSGTVPKVVNNGNSIAVAVAKCDQIANGTPSTTFTLTQLAK